MYSYATYCTTYMCTSVHVKVCAFVLVFEKSNLDKRQFSESACKVQRSREGDTVMSWLIGIAYPCLLYVGTVDCTFTCAAVELACL